MAAHNSFCMRSAYCTSDHAPLVYTAPPACVNEADFQYWLDTRSFHHNEHQTVIDAGWDCGCEFSYYGDPSEDTLRKYYIADQAELGFTYVA